MATALAASPGLFGRHGIETWRSAVVFLWAAVSFIVFKEPAPVDVMFLVVMIFFMRSGLGAAIGVAPLLILLGLYNMGGVLSAIPVMGREKVMMFVITSAYMALSAVFLAYYIARDPVQRFEPIRKGLITAGVLAAIFGIIDFATVGKIFTHVPVPGRATGTFKDPNVFSTFLMMPASFLIYGLLTGKVMRPILSLIALLIILAGIFLSFSRGAWGNLVFTTFCLTTLAFLLNSNIKVRFRIVMAVALGSILMTLAFLALMSDEGIRSLFLERFVLFQHYDSGETGRFSSQLNAIPILMGMPLGMGPLQFTEYFPQDPHNTFLNAFVAYGWLGGFSYICLVVSTLVIGFRAAFTPTPFQHIAIMIYCPLVATMFQGIQIDMDHWRHYYWMIGLMWGVFAATLQYRPQPRPLQAYAPA